MFKSALGDDISLEENTPQGRLIAAITTSRIETLRTCALVANLINPDVAYGAYLDNLCALTNCIRASATRSSVTAVIGGVAGTIIPATTSTAVTENGDVFYLENAATIGADGTVEAIFLAQETGPIKCDIGQLTTIKTGVVGWETITNNTAAVVGTDREGDTQLKTKRAATLYSGRALIGDIQAALAIVDNIQSYYIDQNNKTNPVTKNGITINPHSVYVCVYGGADADVARALYNTVPAGCDYTGSVTVPVTDRYNQQNYDVSFDRATVKQIDVKVYVHKNTGAGDIDEAIIKAISDYQNGQIENIDGLKIGVDVSPFEIASAITASVSTIFVNQVEIAEHGSTLSTDTIVINMNEIAEISAENITIRYI